MRKDVQAVVEVFAESCPPTTSSARSRLVVAITRTSTFRVAVAAHALELLLLEHAQELGLQGGRDLSDLVQEERAAVRQLEATHRGACGLP